jgi:hypothetical protein
MWLVLTMVPSNYVAFEIVNLTNIQNNWNYSSLVEK